MNHREGSDCVSYEQVAGNSLSSESFLSHSLIGRQDVRPAKEPDDLREDDLPLEKEPADSMRSLVSPASPTLDAWRTLVVLAAAFFAYFGPMFAVFLPRGFGFAMILQLSLDLLFTANLVVRLVVANVRWGLPMDNVSWPFMHTFGWLPVSVVSGPVPVILEITSSTLVGRMWPLLLRLLRISELSRFDALKRRWYQGCGLPQSVSEFVKCLFVTSVTAHWVACAWCILNRESEGKDFWFASVVGIKAGPCSGEDLHSDPLCYYSLALYWSMMTLTGVGYHGDVVPLTLAEYRMCTVCTLAMAYVWVYNAGKIFGLLLPPGLSDRRGSAALRISSRKQLQLEVQMSRLLEKNVELEAKIDQMLGELYAGKKLVRMH